MGLINSLGTHKSSWDAMNWTRAEFIIKFNILCNSETKFNNFVDLVNYLLEDEVQMNNLENKLKNLVENVKNFRSKNFNENEQSSKILKEITLISQFSTYNGVEVKVANEAFDDILKEMEEMEEFQLVIKFLRILNFCATIKHSFVKTKRKISIQFCVNYVLPKSRDVLYSVGLGFNFGEFQIKKKESINGGETGSKLKVSDWLVPEKVVERKKKANWKPNLEVINEE
uniref:Uncharacterized protein n=1 Tax=Meloidogyne enterolobii TaxID=390850 RepID=A0A6V7X5W5_MELEN|nr:unnamed protein product [Meloidogyne enterolobii]